MLTVEIETNNAAFEDKQEAARILRDLADRIENGLGSMTESGALFDINGNRVGNWSWAI